ncbi:MAG: hypothetical protein R3358_11755 [Woeseiaceae bacterium]|nr:hypothetical protein [Woeseiaceae bacterium]
MNTLRPALAALIVVLLVPAQAPAAEHRPPSFYENWIRWEASLGMHAWPSIGDIDPFAGGSFDELGFNLGFAVHVRTRQQQQRELLAGFDVGFFSSESNITLFTEDLTARGLYATPSVKWMFGANRQRYSLDAGIGYYLVDIAEVTSIDFGYSEVELWQASGVGGYLGGTWDIAPRDPLKTRGWMLGLKVHFFDLGDVRDENPALPARLGPAAGDLKGPVYQLQFGYRWR